MISKEIQVFNFSDAEIRTITTPEGEVYFVASDVCKVLDLSNVAQAISRLDNDEKSTIILNEHGRDYEKPIITEGGFYSLVLRSDKSQAKGFQKWVTSEVLPAIRKTGKYEVAQKPMDTLDIMSMAIQQMREQREELKAIAEKQESFEADRAEANAYLEERQNEPVQTLFVTVRKALDDLVKSYAVSTGADVKVAYTLLYKEFSLRYSINVYRNAKKQNLSGMSWIEANGYIAQVYEIAKDLFNSKAILAKKGVQNAQ